MVIESLGSVLSSVVDLLGERQAGQQLVSTLSALVLSVGVPAMLDETRLVPPLASIVPGWVKPSNHPVRSAA